jgi:zinc transport system substrate-binding protein
VKSKAKEVIVNILFTLLLCLAACGSPPPHESKKPTVLVSLAPYAYVVKKIAGESVVVQTLVPQGANPHLYEAPPKQVAEHQNASLWIYLGENSDRKLLQFFKEQSHPIQTLDLAEGIELLEEGHTCSLHESSKDLHLWMSPSLMRVHAQKITEALCTLIPAEKERLHSNLATLLSELALLDATLSALLESKQGTTLLVSHPAFGYFCKDYGLHQLSIEIEGKEPRPQELDHILSHALDEQISLILTEPQHSNKGAEALASVLHLPTHEVDPYAENYPETLLHLAELIAP